MARLRVRLEIKRAEKGVPLDKLADLAAKAQRLVRSVSRDAPLGGSEGQWIARNFKEGSLSFDIEYFGEADDAQVTAYSHALESVIEYKPDTDLPTAISADTVVTYARIGFGLEGQESVRIGVYANGEDRPAKWHDVSRSEASVLLDYFESPITYHGSVQGIIHSLYKEANPPYFDLRELSTSRLVKCHYAAAQYPTVIKLLKRHDAVVLVSGTASANRLDRKIERIQVDRMSVVDALTHDEFATFIGCAPGMTGAATTSEFLDHWRRRDG